MMKARLLLLLLLATAQVCMADDYQPFAKEGRTWVIREPNGAWPISVAYIDGDTIINDRQCHKIMVQNLLKNTEWGEPRYYSSVYEEGKRVYLYQEDRTTPELLYDFGVQVGDTVRRTLIDTYYVEHIDTLQIAGRSYKRMFMEVPGREVGFKYADVWVEGIGSLMFFSLSSMWYSEFHSLLENGTEVFTRSDFRRTTVPNPYQPMLADGKKWSYSYIAPERPSDTYSFSYDLQIDSLQAHMFPCYRVYSHNAYNNRKDNYEGMAYEMNHCVYLIPSYGVNRLLYDFNLTEGQELDLSLNAHNHCYSVGMLEHDGTHRKVLNMGYKGSFMLDTGVIGCWVEGIGNSDSWLDSGSWCPARYFHLDSCSLGGKVLFVNADFPLPEAIEPEMQRTEYRPMLVEGKIWHYLYTDYFADIYDYPMDYVLRGDTVVEGKTYYKMYEETPDSQSYYCAWREEGKRIYRLNKGAKEALWYDFGLPYHGQIPYSLLFDIPVYFEKTEVVKAEGGYFTRHQNINSEYIFTSYCIEGIGGFNGLLRPGIVSVPNGKVLSFSSCEENGKIIFREGDIGKPAVDYTNVEAPHATRQSSQTLGLFDLQGRRLNALPAKGLYVKDGKKYVK